MKNNYPIESRKTEIRFKTNDPSKMLGKWVASRAIRIWQEEFIDSDTGKTIQIERKDVLLERGTYIDKEELATINFFLQEGSISEVEVSNQNRQGVLLTNHSLFPYKAVVKIDDKRKTLLLYATSVANAILILADFIELNYKGGFEIKEIKEMDYCVVLIDSLKPAEIRKYELDEAYLKGEMSTEDYAIATADQIARGNPDAEATNEEVQGKKFYEIGAHVVLSNDKEGSEQDHTFIVQTVSAVRANMLIEKYLRDQQEQRYQESLANPDRTFVKYDIKSFIETSKIIPIGCFTPLAFPVFYNNETANC